MGSKQSSTTTVTRSPEEIAFQGKQLEIAQQQLDLIKQNAAFQQTAFDKYGPILDAQAAEMERQGARAKELEPIQDELLQRELEAIRRGGAASPEQMAAIDDAIGSSQSRGEIDINRFLGESFEGLREELAPSMGLRPTDTPIFDRGARIAAEGVRQQGALTETLAGARANATLNFPLAAQQVQSGQIQFQQGLMQAQNQFQQQLRDAAFTNRLRLTGTQGGLGVSLIGASSPIAPSFGGSQTTTTRGGGFGIGQVLGGVGGLASGLGAIGIGF
jgi:hypothetical protein